MSDTLSQFPPSFSESYLRNSLHVVFSVLYSIRLDDIRRLLWVVESMWIIFVPAFCGVAGTTVYRQTKSPFYSLLTAVSCGVVWLISRYYVLGQVPIFLSPPFKECVSIVRLLLHNIRTQVKGKYIYSYPLIVNLGILRKYQLSQEFVPISDPLIDKAVYHRLHRYMNFAAASYGVLFYPKHAKSSIQRVYKRFRTASFTTTVSENVISEMTGIPDRDIIMTQLKGENPLRPGYYLCIDHDTDAIILVIRGTLTLSDALTDISCASREFVGGMAHHGISVSAMSIFEEVKVILENLLHKTGYSLVICGHSLGAGTAVLLTIYLLSNRHDQSECLSKCKINCYAYAPPPVYRAVDKMPEEWSDRIITVINGCDIIPRVSLANMYKLLLQMQYIDKLHLSFWERCNLIMEKEHDTVVDLLKVRSFLCCTDDIDTSSLGVELLHHIGQILWVDVRETESGTGTTTTTPVLLNQSPNEWESIYIGNNFAFDHWPHGYQRTLKLFTDQSQPSL